MRVFNSFQDLGKVFGVHPKERKEKPFNCRKCGNPMKHIPGTNVFLCLHVDDNGKECGNRVLAKFVS